MNITLVYGTERKGCTYNIAQEVIKEFKDARIKEIFLPVDLPEYCVSCFRCFQKKGLADIVSTQCLLEKNCCGQI